ncbi:hypothetical protein FA13DRAFT_1731765 [Coprinellus micaceus]|uniref:F-box domain-containing protein n=1 Tax=Coprinellus micaceus TaxID=71717 RepID=A0A4Y7TEF6_COPMI|nr:hypothetical protein FA13DRAFT_1731765 [Coprinellus micaceus]
MHRCLHVPEVGRCIASDLDKEDAYHLAITCKDMLNPCLDEVWCEIHSLEPLIACLPEDLWSNAGSQPQGDDQVTILDQGRELLPADLLRYTTHYAPRIRILDLRDFGTGKILSIETLHNLQLLTGCQSGALSPLLKVLMWQDAEYLEDLAGQDYAMWFPTHTSLFMGESVEKLTASLFSDDPAAHKVAFHAGMRRREANLTNLWITGKEVIERCFQSFPFSMLDTLAIHGADMAVLPDLTSLPRLRDLTIRNPQMANPPQPVSPTKTSVVETFKLLQQLRVTASVSVRGDRGASRSFGGAP